MVPFSVVQLLIGSQVFKGTSGGMYLNALRKVTGGQPVTMELSMPLTGEFWAMITEIWRWQFSLVQCPTLYYMEPKSQGIITCPISSPIVSDIKNLILSTCFTRFALRTVTCFWLKSLICNLPWQLDRLSFEIAVNFSKSLKSTKPLFLPFMTFYNLCLTIRY